MAYFLDPSFTRNCQVESLTMSEIKSLRIFIHLKSVRALFRTNMICYRHLYLYFYHEVVIIIIYFPEKKWRFKLIDLVYDLSVKVQRSEKHASIFNIEFRGRSIALLKYLPRGDLSFNNTSKSVENEKYSDIGRVVSQELCLSLSSSRRFSHDLQKRNRASLTSFLSTLRNLETAGKHASANSRNLRKCVRLARPTIGRGEFHDQYHRLCRFVKLLNEANNPCLPIVIVTDLTLLLNYSRFSSIIFVNVTVTIFHINSILAIF